MATPGQQQQQAAPPATNEQPKSDKMDVDPKEAPKNNVPAPPAELTQEGYAKATTRFEEIKKVISEKGEDVDPTLLIELSSVLTQMNNYKDREMEKLANENNNLKGKVFKSENEQTDSLVDFLKNLYKTPVGKESFEAAGINEERIAKFGDMIKKINDPHTLSELNDFIPTIACACSKSQGIQSEKLGASLEAERRNSRRQQMNQLQQLLKDPVQKIARVKNNVSVGERFTNPPQNMNEYNGRNVQTPPSIEKTSEDLASRPLPNASLADLVSSFNSRYPSSFN